MSKWLLLESRQNQNFSSLYQPVELNNIDWEGFYNIFPRFEYLKYVLREFNHLHQPSLTD